MPSTNTDAYIYHVMRHTDDRHNGGEDTEIRGSYATLKEANAAARVDLTKEWDLNFFESHEVEVDSDGMVSVTAECPEGEIMSVFIEKKKVAQSVAKVVQKKSTAQEADIPVLKEVWIITQTDYEHHTDEEGRSSIAVSTVYESLREANEAARYALLDACGIEDEDDDDTFAGIELTEENRDSATKAYIGDAVVFQDDRHAIKIEVEKLAVKYSDAGTKRRAASSSSKGSKKRKIEAEEIIDISSD
ncbi:hypothetical protein DFH06DRAFT_1170764 [Mycena polygramma]|nr:hypothetical protein DFH06DRAFT_1170764 [Mycena polygramma]